MRLFPWAALGVCSVTLGVAADGCTPPITDDDDADDDDVGDDDSGDDDSGDDDSADPNIPLPPCTMDAPSFACWNLRWGGRELSATNDEASDFVPNEGDYVVLSYVAALVVHGSVPSRPEIFFLQAIEVPAPGDPPPPDADRFDLWLRLPEGMEILEPQGERLRIAVALKRAAGVVRAGLGVYRTTPETSEPVVLVEFEPFGPIVPLGGEHPLAVLAPGEDIGQLAPMPGCSQAQPQSVTVTLSAGQPLGGPPDPVFTLQPGDQIDFVGRRGEFTMWIPWSWRCAVPGLCPAAVCDAYAFVIAGHTPFRRP